MKQNVIDDYNLLSGQQKAAILMMSLDEDKSAQIFALMDDEEIKELSVIMASLGKVNSNVVEQLFQEFAEKSSNTGTLIGTFESTERLLSKTLDKDRVSAIMEEISGPAGRTMWDKLGKADCRIEWENGGVERNSAELGKKIEDLLAVKPEGKKNDE